MSDAPVHLPADLTAEEIEERRFALAARIEEMDGRADVIRRARLIVEEFERSGGDRADLIREMQEAPPTGRI